MNKYSRSKKPIRLRHSLVLVSLAVGEMLII